MEPLHISKLNDKRAKTIVATNLLDEPYHNAIKQAAQKLVDSGRGEYRYLSQVESYSTFWENPEGGRIIIERKSP